MPIQLGGQPLANRSHRSQERKLYNNMSLLASAVVYERRQPATSAPDFLVGIAVSLALAQKGNSQVHRRQETEMLVPSMVLLAGDVIFACDPSDKDWALDKMEAYELLAVLSSAR
jgi:hypothetical protein